MKQIYKFVAASSRATPAGIALAIVVALAFRTTLGGWAGALYLGILILTLAASTCEPVQ